MLSSDLTAIIEPLKVEYDTIIDEYDAEITRKQDEEIKAKQLEEAKLLNGRLSQLEGIITQDELEFIDIAEMNDEKFAKFVEYRKSIVVTTVKEKLPDPVTAEQEELATEEVVDDAEINNVDDSTNVDTKITLELLTIDDEIGQFANFRTRFMKIKKPALIESPTALAVREAIDNLQESLDNILEDEYK